MKTREQAGDELLKIRTAGRDDSAADQYHHPYEPTPYGVLERLADSGLIGEADTLLDYGCGKGRVGFYLSYRTRAKTIGIEFDGDIYRLALENGRTALSGKRATFVQAAAEGYCVPEEVTGCYFFNPFSGEILHKVMARILDSYYASPREILLFFYYPSDEFVSCLMQVEELEFYDEIGCGDLFPGNDPRERILIFQLPVLESMTDGEASVG